MRRFALQLFAGIGIFAGIWLAAERLSGRDDTPGAPSASRPEMPPGREAPPRDLSPGGKTSDRIREGTRLIDQAGTFQSMGDRIAFVPKDSKDSFRVLENLALHRINLSLQDGRGQRTWVVTGMITEFGESNYLLISKAVMRAQEGDSALGN